MIWTFKLPSGIPIERIFGNPRLLDESEIEALLADGNDCVDVPGAPTGVRQRLVADE